MPGGEDGDAPHQVLGAAEERDAEGKVRGDAEEDPDGDVAGLLHAGGGGDDERGSDEGVEEGFEGKDGEKVGVEAEHAEGQPGDGASAEPTCEMKGCGDCEAAGIVGAGKFGLQAVEAALGAEPLAEEAGAEGAEAGGDAVAGADGQEQEGQSDCAAYADR